MDALGLLQAVVAVAVYPGGAFLGLAAWAFRRTSGARGVEPMNAAGVAAAAAACLAAALAPLPASPAAILPPQGRAAPNLAVAALLLGGAIGVGARGPWDRRRTVAAAVALVPVAALAAGSATLALPAVITQPGVAFIAARSGAAAAVLATAPLICRTYGPGQAAVHSVLVAAAAVLALSLVVPPQLTGWAAAGAAAGVLVAAAAYGLILRVISRAATFRHRLLLTLGTAAGAASVAAIAVAAR